MKLTVAAAAVAVVFLAKATPGVHATAADDAVTPGEHGLSYGPLQCNLDANPAIESDDCVSNAALLSDLVANVTDTGAPVTVPCGTCARVDYTDGSTVTIPGGLNVLGRLHFPTSASVTLNTTSVFVQGHLDMGIPDAGKNVKITLYGTEDHFLYPHEHCCDNIMNHRSLSTGGCNPDCEHKKAVGKKPFVVAGGQLDIRTVDPTCPSWTTLKDVGQIPDGSGAEVGKNFVVDPAFASCVRPGDDLIVTSDTHGGWNNHFEWVAETIVDEASGIVAMVGSTSRKFATEAGPGEPYFAAEVANLRRDVVIEAQKDDPDELIGGHLMIFHTPDVSQTIAGVRFDNFGQAGNLGRYPIHFHMCGPSPSTVSKNVITNSNQRCVVIHNTNEVLIDDNIAYKTRGHCYVTETGAETENSFIHNLGAETTRLGRFNGQSDSSGSSDPHHDEPSTFWIRNAQNTWIGNVAAGAEINGWWFEMFNKKNTPLYTFKDNAVHSSQQGLITYPGGGWQPSNDAVIENFRTYKNAGNSRGDGFKFFSSGSFTIKNAIMADNYLGIKEFFNSAPMIVLDSRFIGISEDARLRLGKTCSSGSGLRFSYNTYNQMQLKNVSFEGYSCGGRAIAPYPELRFGGEPMMGEPLGTVEVTLEEGQDPLANDGAWTMYMEDVNGTMGPSDKGPGFFVENTENTPRHTAFIPESQCSSISGNTLFCEDVCLRHMEIFPDNQHVSSDIKYEKLVLTKDGTTTFKYDRQDSYSGKHFDVVLPPGSYVGHFEDASGTAVNARDIHFETRSPPKREGCEYVAPSSIAFETTPYPEARFYNYAAGKWLWAKDSNSDRTNMGAREDLEPADETVWSVEEVECPEYTLYQIPGDKCYIINGGGSSRRTLYATDNGVWTGGVGAQPGMSVGSTYIWKLLRAECGDGSDPRPCVYIVNARNGRRLYQHDEKTDFGASPKGDNGSADWKKWYMEDAGSATNISTLELDTFSPTPAPTHEPTVSHAPTQTVLSFVNYGTGGSEYLWVEESTEYWGHIGASANPTQDGDTPQDTDFVLQSVGCPTSPMYDIPGDTCYNLVGGGSYGRKIFATNDLRGYGAGMGAGTSVGDEGKWKLISADCNLGDPRPCVFIVNAKNGRKLIKDASGAFGGTTSGFDTIGDDDTKWYIDGFNGLQDIATYAPTPAPTPVPTEAPTPSAATLKFANFGSGGTKYLWKRTDTNVWGGVGADESPAADQDTDWVLEETGCPTNSLYSIPGDTCYLMIGGGTLRRKVFSTNDDRDLNFGMGGDSKVRNDGKWKLISAECDSQDPRPCVYITNAYNGRKLVEFSKTDKFGATMRAGHTHGHDDTKWYIEGSGAATSALSIATAPFASVNVKFSNYGAAGNYLWTDDVKDTWGAVGTKDGTDPSHEIGWSLEETSCPSNQYAIPGDNCYFIRSGGVYRRRLLAQTDRTWNSGIGARPLGGTVYNDHKWRLLDAPCDSGGQTCVHIVNALNARRLYKSAVTGQFGATPKGVVNDHDDTKWIVEDLGSGSPASSLDAATLSTTPHIVQFTSTDVNGGLRYLWADGDRNTDWNYLNADLNPSEEKETEWILETVSCPTTPLYPDLNPGDVCYTINSVGLYRRRLFAWNDHQWTGGVGASIGSSIGNNHKWKLVPTTCANGDACIFIANAYNARRLYKHDVKTDFGASPKGDTGSAEWRKWRMIDVNVP